MKSLSVGDDGLVPEKAIPVRLTKPQLAATFAPVGEPVAQTKQPIFTWRSQSASYTAGAGFADQVDTTNGAVVATLPSTNKVGDPVLVKKMDATTNTVTIAGTINGTASATLTLRLQDQGKVLVGDGTGNWNVQSGDNSLVALTNYFNGAYAPLWQPNTAYVAGARVVNPSGDLVTAVTGFTSGASYVAANWNLSTSYAPAGLVGQLAANPDQMAVGTITRSTTGAATGFTVAWPTGATGTFAGAESTTNPGAIDSYTVTHVLAGVTKTYTQPALTRDANGAVTARPAMTVS